MFRSFIYLDSDKLYTYKRQLDGNNHAIPEELSQKKSAEFSATVKGFGVNRLSETNISSKYEKDICYDYDHFELDLGESEGEDYFDYVMNPDYDLSTIPAMKIIRICDRFSIPEAFDAVNLIERFKPLLMGQIDVKSSSDETALGVLEQASADIPITIELDDLTISGKLRAQFLKEDYPLLEEYSEQEVYMLCKVVGIARKESVEIFDPLKDFIRLPRSTRRQFEQDGNTLGLEKIRIDGPVLKVEFIAIYK